MLMEQVEVVDVEDGREKDLNVSVKNGVKLHSASGDFLLCARKPEQKQRWLQAFADERKQVQNDRETGERRSRQTHPDLTLCPRTIHCFLEQYYVS